MDSNKSLCLQMGIWKGVSDPSLGRTDGPLNLLVVWFTCDLQSEKNCLDVREKAEATVFLWSWRRVSLKGRVEVCATHIYPTLLYLFSVLPHQCTELILLIPGLFHQIWGKSTPRVRREMCLFLSSLICT